MLKKNLIYKKLKKYHKVVSLVLLTLIILFSLSGILLNHRGLIGNVDINRSYLPNKYQLKNWNRGSIKSGLKISKDITYFYGNIGVIEQNHLTNNLKLINDGMKKGQDFRKVNDLILWNNKVLIATNSGIYQRTEKSSRWSKLHFNNLGTHRIESLSLYKEKLIVATRHSLYEVDLEKYTETSLNEISPITLQTPVEIEEKISLFKVLWVIHSGEVFGLLGKLLVDFVGIIFIILSLTGLVFYIYPKLNKKKKIKNRLFKKSFRQYNKIVHLFIAKWTLLMLGITAMTGMFLRPPLLIPISSKSIERPNFSMISRSYAWHDRIRGLKYDKVNDCFYLFLSGGELYRLNDLHSMPSKIYAPIPISVMGVNVFHFIDRDHILIGSFSGLFIWNIRTNQAIDYFTRELPVPSSMPISDNLISGYFYTNDGDMIFDYDHGLVTKTHKFEMSDNLVTKMPLWNLALEIHTGRFFSPLVGVLYFLIVPLTGGLLLLILLTGTGMWLIGRKKRKIKKNRSYQIEILSYHKKMEV